MSLSVDRELLSRIIGRDPLYPEKILTISG